MSKLGPDDEDLEWLVDNSPFDAQAFSHVVFERSDENAVSSGAGVRVGL